MNKTLAAKIIKSGMESVSTKNLSAEQSAELFSTGYELFKKADLDQEAVNALEVSRSFKTAHENQLHFFS